MTTVYTTQRTLSVRESYEVIADCLGRKEQNLIELTEVLISYQEFPKYEKIEAERKVLIQTQYIVEIN
jgi:hypothetical protein